MPPEKVKKQIYGRTHSDETKAKIGAAGKGRIFSDEAKAKMSAAKKGKPKSEEHRDKLSDANKGKILSDVVKSRISASLTGRKEITNGTQRKRVHLEQLESFLNDGWVLISKT